MVGYFWRMPLNTDKTKPAHEVMLSLKTKNIIYPNFYKVTIGKTSSQNFLGLSLNARLTFDD